MKSQLHSQPQVEQLEGLMSRTRKPHGKENCKDRFLLLLLIKELEPLLGHENERCRQIFHYMVRAKSRNFTSVEMMHSLSPSSCHPTAFGCDLENYLYGLVLIKR